MTTPPTWTLTGDEFDWVWRQETRFDDAYDHPDPLAVRTTPTTEPEGDKLRETLRERFPRGGDRGLSAMFAIMANADTRVACVNTVGDTEIRCHGAALEGLGVVAAQRITPTEGGGPVRLALVSRATVPAHLAAILPNTEPGGAGPIVGYTPRVRGQEPPTSWNRDAAGRLPAEERIRKLMRLRRSAEGYFVIERNPGNHRPIQYLNWIDIPPGQFASGRYLIEVNDNDTTVIPASPDIVAREISKRGHFHTTPKRQDD
ncbi:ESX secretion-associated protein EspG [Nocardia sp. NPDC058497]|uniref:ESX secretion-associated protein EspG n=1 Tax=Nocardia sp. NPDC058497 TaxID=3346529 RepID=UPI00365CB592